MVFKRPTLKGIVVIPHPKKDLPVGTVTGIRKSARGIP
jgi:predicted RNA binding protein YcfA (HicA-like mRNA interferase family)